MNGRIPREPVIDHIGLRYSIVGGISGGLLMFCCIEHVYVGSSSALKKSSLCGSGVAGPRSERLIGRALRLKSSTLAASLSSFEMTDGLRLEGPGEEEREVLKGKLTLYFERKYYF